MREAVDDIKIVGHVPAEDRNVAASKIRENTKQPLNVHQLPVVSHEAEASPSEDAGGFPSDASEFRCFIGRHGKLLKHGQEPGLKHRPISPASSSNMAACHVPSGVCTNESTTGLRMPSSNRCQRPSTRIDSFVSFLWYVLHERLVVGMFLFGQALRN